MYKNTGKEKKKYFLILQISIFNLDKFLALWTVLGKFIRFPESQGSAQLYPNL